MRWWRPALVFAILLSHGAAAQQQNHVRITVHCDKGVIGESVVNLYADNIFVGGSFTALVCGDHAVIPTDVGADSYAALTTVTTPDGFGFCPMAAPEPLPDTVICTVDGDRHSPGATVRFHKPK